MPLIIDRVLKKNIFISYQSQDYDFAKDIEIHIKNGKYNHDKLSGKLSVTLFKTDDFFDKTSLLFEKIKKNIYKSDCVVVILNKNISDWVLSEITIARVFRKPIIIIVISKKIDFSKSICEGYPVLHKDGHYDFKKTLFILLDNIIENKTKKNTWILICFSYMIYSVNQLVLFYEDILFMYFVLFKTLLLLLYFIGINIIINNIYFGDWKNGGCFRELILDENVMKHSLNKGRNNKHYLYVKRENIVTLATLVCIVIIVFKGFLLNNYKGVTGIMVEESINLIALYIPILSVLFTNRMIK